MHLFKKLPSKQKTLADIRRAALVPRQERVIDRFIRDSIDLKTDMPQYQDALIGRDVRELCEMLPEANRLFLRIRADYTLGLLEKMRRQKVEMQAGSQAAKLAHIIDSGRKADLPAVRTFVTDSSRTAGSFCSPLECRRQLGLIEDLLVFDKPSDWDDLPGAKVGRPSLGCHPLRKERQAHSLLSRISSIEGTWDENRQLNGFAPYVK